MRTLIGSTVLVVLTACGGIASSTPGPGAGADGGARADADASLDPSDSTTPPHAQDGSAPGLLGDGSDIVVVTVSQAEPPAATDTISEAPYPSCPAHPPSAGDPCIIHAGACTYGAAYTADCRDAFACPSGAWVVQNAKVPCEGYTSKCAAPSPYDLGVCPGGADCHFDDGTVCSCFDQTNMQDTWTCTRPSAGCPSIPPNMGEPCTSTLRCTYGPVCGPGTVAACVDGLWRARGVHCPDR